MKKTEMQRLKQEVASLPDDKLLALSYWFQRKYAPNVDPVERYTQNAMVVRMQASCVSEDLSRSVEVHDHGAFDLKARSVIVSSKDVVQTILEGNPPQETVKMAVDVFNENECGYTLVDELQDPKMVRRVVFKVPTP